MLVYMKVYMFSEMETQFRRCVSVACTIDGLVDNPVARCRRLRWIPGDPEAVVPLF